MRFDRLKRSLAAGVLPTAAIAAHLAMAAAAPSAAQAADEPLAVSGKLVGKVKDGEFKKSEDVSGLACAGDVGVYPRICLLADDESQGAQVVILHQDHLVAGEFIRLIEDSFKDKPLELDAEGVAYADGSFYVIGSHGRPRHGDPSEEAMNIARAAATRHVFRIKLDPAAVSLETGKISKAPKIDDDHGKLAGLIAGDTTLGDFHDKALEDNGLTIEGVAARGLMLYAGLRAPVLDDGSAVIVSAPISTLFDGAQGQLTLDRVMLGQDTLRKPRGIRDLVAFGDDFLIIAGPAQDPDSSHSIAPSDYAIYRKHGSRLEKMDLKAYGTKTKPEALLVMEQSDQALTGLILFDGPKEGEPRLVGIRTQ